MTTHESRMWQRLRPVLVNWGLDPVRIESGVGIGIPDVNITTGWIELKRIPSRPKQTKTKVAVPHFTKEQRIWLRQRSRAGGRVWLLLLIEDIGQLVLFEGAVAADYLGKVSWPLLVGKSALLFGELSDSRLRMYLDPPR